MLLHVTTADGMFAGGDTYITGHGGEQVSLSTNFIFPEGRCVCGCWRSPLVVSLVNTARTDMGLYSCFIGATNPRQCNDNANFTISPNGLTLSGRNIINFSLVFKNVSLSDSGMYRYLVESGEISDQRIFTLNVLGK